MTERMTDEQLAEWEAMLGEATPGLTLSGSSSIIKIWKIEFVSDAGYLVLTDAPLIVGNARQPLSENGDKATLKKPSNTRRNGYKADCNATLVMMHGENVLSEPIAQNTTSRNTPNDLNGCEQESLHRNNCENCMQSQTADVFIAKKPLNADSHLATLVDSITLFLEQKGENTESKTSSFVVGDVTVSSLMDEHDATLIAAAPTIIRALLAEVRALRRALEGLRNELVGTRDFFGDGKSDTYKAITTVTSVVLERLDALASCAQTAEDGVIQFLISLITSRGDGGDDGCLVFENVVDPPECDVNTTDPDACEKCVLAWATKQAALRAAEKEGTDV